MRAGTAAGAGGLLLALLGGAAAAQRSPGAPLVPAAVRPDSLVARPPEAALPDTARPAEALVPAAEPADPVTRRLAVRIAAAVAVLTLSTLLLYNVRSR